LEENKLNRSSCFVSAKMSSLTNAIIASNENSQESENGTETENGAPPVSEDQDLSQATKLPDHFHPEIPARFLAQYRDEFPSKPGQFPAAEPVLHTESSVNSPISTLNARESANDVEDEVFQLICVQVYLHSAQHVLKINRTITGRDICRALERRLSLSREEAKFYSLLCVVTIFDPEKRTKVYCIRTLLNDEIVLNMLDHLTQRLMFKFSIMDSNKLKNAVRWFYKDVRTAPILLEDNYNNFDTIGEESSDEEDELSHSDLSYLVKSDRKGYLLKRSQKDINLWKKWYCILTDHLWCIDVNNPTPKFLCIRLNGVQRSRGNNVQGEQLSNIIINSTRGTHLLRAFTIQDQKNWIEDLHQRILYTTDNEAINMAEVIICDEELTKNKRFHKSLLQDFLATDCILEAISHQYFQYYKADQSPPFSSFPMSDILSIKEIRRPSVNDDSTIYDRNTDNNGLEAAYQASIAREKLETAGKPSTSTDPKRKNIAFNLDNEFRKNEVPAAQTIHDFEDGDDDDDDEEETKREKEAEEELRDSEAEARMVYKYCNSLDRSFQPFIVHNLHTQFHNYYNTMKFLIEVFQYKELFRIDLYTTAKAQRIMALNIFINFLIKQILDDEIKEFILIKIVDLPEKLKKHGIKSTSSTSHHSSKSGSSRPLSSSRHSTAVVLSPKNNSSVPTEGLSPVPTSTSSSKIENTTVSKRDSRSISPKPSVKISTTTSNDEENGGDGSKPLTPTGGEGGGSSRQSRGRFPVYNAMKNQYLKRKEQQQQLERGNSNRSLLTKSLSRSTSQRRNSLLKREVSFNENDLSWGIHEENIMKVFYRLFPEHNPENMTNSRATNTPMTANSPNPSNHSVEEIAYISTRSSLTPGGRSLKRSGNSNTGMSSVSQQQSTTTSSSWYWPWGSTPASTAVTPPPLPSSSSAASSAALKTPERPPSMLSPANMTTPSNTHSFAVTPDRDTPHVDSGTASQSFLVTIDLFDEVIEELLQLLKEKPVLG
jgi:hypothetical protein